MNETRHRPPPLQGLLVADFSRVLAGPLATMFLADLGATVVKVERPGAGDDTRAWGPPYVGTTSTYFTSVNRNKRSVTLDLTDASDLALAHELARRADILVQNFLPGRLAGFGLDHGSVSRSNPGVVYCSISGFGAGAGADLPGYDFLAQALSGLMSITGPAEGEPTKVGVAVVDVLTGLHATIGILAALRSREQTGLGQQVEVDLLSSGIASLVNQAAAYLNGAGAPTRMGNRHPSITPYETFATRDRPLAVAVGNDRQFRAFAAALGRDDLATDPRYADNPERVANRDSLVAAIELTLGERDAAHWAAVLGAAGVACGPVNDVAGGIELATALGLAPTVTFDGDGGPVTTVANPIRLAATPVRYERPPPALGADSAAVRAWLASPDTSLDPS